MKNVIRCLITFCSIYAIPQSAEADEWQQYHKFSCIPEIGYMELTTTESYKFLTKEQQKKYDLNQGESIERGVKYKCSFPEQNTDVEFRLTDPDCGMHSCYKLEVYVNEKIIFETEKFGNHYPIYEAIEDGFATAAFPYLIAFDFGMLGTYLHVCTGSGKRECNSYDMYRQNFIVKENNND